MHFLADLSTFVFGRIARFVLTQKGIADIASFVGVLTLCIIAEYARTRSVARYRSRGLRTDLLYSAVYLSGAYSMFVGLPMYRMLTSAIARYAPFLQTHALDGLPAPVQFMIALVIPDLTYYLWHRTVHATPFLWAFHSIHHSQETLTVATSLRVHVFEEVVRSLFYFVPAAILGLPTRVWLPLDLTMNWLLLLEHSDLNWTYGILGKVIVSPHYHRIHHSVDPKDLDRNFGAFLSIWDPLFGTVSRRATRPEAYGAPQMGVPESFFRQILFPILWLIRRYNVNPVREQAAALPLPAPSPSTSVE